MHSRALIVAIPAFIVAFSGGCAGDRHVRALNDTLVQMEIASATGRPHEAVRQAEAWIASGSAPDERCLVRVVQARAIVRTGHAGRLGAVLEDLRDACSGNPDRSAEGLFILATAGGDVGDPALLRAVISRFPDSPAAVRALDHLQARLASTPAAFVAECRALYRVAGSGAIGAHLLLRSGLVLAALPPSDPRRTGAAPLFRQVAYRHSDSALADDARVEWARLLLAEGRPGTAIRVVQPILDARESSWFFLSYDTPAVREAVRLDARAREALR